MSTQSSASPDLIKELEQAETRMFQHVKFSGAKEYFKKDVSNDFFTINADGVWADKQQSLAGTARLKMFEMADEQAPRVRHYKQERKTPRR